MSGRDLTTTQAAVRLGVGKSTVNLWCRQGRFPNAYAREEARGHVWYIPESDLSNFTMPERGRPPKATQSTPDAGKRATGQASASKGTPAKRRGRKAA